MRFLILISLLFLGQISLSGQDVAQLLKNQDFDQLGLLVASDARLKIDSDKRVKGSDAVISVLRKKLASFAPTRIEENHSGSSEVSDSDYIITNLYNAQNESLRIFIHISELGDTRKIGDIKGRSLYTFSLIALSYCISSMLNI